MLLFRPSAVMQPTSPEFGVFCDGCRSFRRAPGGPEPLRDILDFIGSLLACRGDRRSYMQNDGITQLLQSWRGGDDDALQELTPLVYGQLRKLATRIFRHEVAGHTLQPTALVNELFQRLIGADIDWHDRNHFYALSARMMRRILVNHANSKKAAKRGGDALRVTFHEGSVSTDNAQIGRAHV